MSLSSEASWRGSGSPSADRSPNAAHRLAALRPPPPHWLADRPRGRTPPYETPRAAVPIARTPPQVVQDHVVAHQLVREQRLNPRIKIILGRLGESPNRLISEDSLQDSLGEHRGASGDPDLGPDQTSGVGEYNDHQRHTDPIDTECVEPRSGALAHALVGDQIEDSALPVANGARGLPVEVGRGPRQVDGGIVDQRTAGGVGLPRRLRALCCGRCLLAQQDSRPDSTATFRFPAPGGSLEASP